MRDETAKKLLTSLGEHAAREVLNECGTRAAIREFDRRCAVQFALALLSQKVRRPIIRQRLMSRYSYSWSSAYRIITQALVALYQSHYKTDMEAINNACIDNKIPKELK